VLTTGDVLNGRYRLEEPLASGGMGEVWRATDTVLGRTVAVKLLRIAAAGDPGFATRFHNEARTMAALHHPNVAPVYDYDAGGDGRPAYLVTALVAGEPLDRRIAVAGRLDPAETMSIVTQAAHALHAVHGAGIVHRDVKPGNLIVQDDGTVVLIDFGIARSPESAAVTAPGEAVGTARYMAPEQVSKQPVTPLADVYSLGVVAYHCLAGRPPFLGDNPALVAMSHLRDDAPPLPAGVPPEAREVVTTAMAKNPADRFPTAAAMAAAAGTLAGSASASVTRDGAAPGDAARGGAVPVGAGAAGPDGAGGAGPAGPDGAGGAGPAGPDGAGGAVPAGPDGAGGPGGVRGSAPAGTPAAAPVATPAWRRRRAAVWAAVLVGLTAIGIVLAVADPIGIMPGPGSPPATPAPVTPESGGGAGGGNSPGGSGGPGGGTPTTPGGETPGAPGGGGTPGGGTGTTGPTDGPTGTAPGPTSTGDTTDGSTTNPGSTDGGQPNATPAPSQQG
jgi:eukaryotic-like serine/threonine-protein kinase